MMRPASGGSPSRVGRGQRRLGQGWGMRELAAAWRSLVDKVAPAADLREVERVGAQLLRRWSEPHRGYHNVDHLAAVLDTIGEYAATAGDADAVRLAAWYHDAVYDPARADNEAASAALAVTELTALGVGAGIV